MSSVDAVGAEVADSGQMELLGLPVLSAEREATIAARKAGRPPGARNKRVEDIGRLIDAKFGDARLHQARIATMDVDELAERYHCTRVEAETMRRLAFVAVAPYVYQRAPVAVDLRNHRIVTLTINLGDAAGAGETGEVLVLDPQQYQEVSEDADAQV